MQEWLNYLLHALEALGAGLLGAILKDIYKYLKIPKEQRKNIKKSKQITKLNKKMTKIKGELDA